MPVTVRKATINDLEKLYAIEKEAFTREAFSKNQIAYLLQSRNAVNLVAQEAGKLVGFIIGLIYGGNGEKIGRVYTLDVALDARRRGVGQRLLTGLEEHLKVKGVKVCYLEVRADNSAALRLYQKNGYEEIALLKDYYFPRGDGVRLRKYLNDDGEV